MKISDAQFAGSSTKISEKPKRRLSEFAFIGRSNVGKSSLINTLCNKKKLAKTSGTPGKTRLINHFLINDSWYLVDLPGYGYAKMSKTEKAKLTTIINNYIIHSEELIQLFVLVDCRHDIQQIDIDFINQLGSNQIPFSIIYTKTDKLSQTALNKQIEKNKEILSEWWEEMPLMFTSSSSTGNGCEEILEYIGSVLKTI